MTESEKKLAEALMQVINGATRTMGKDSCDREYAHIRQDILDIGRVALIQAGYYNVHSRG